jgi:rRNA-processing protein FCF1
MPIQFLNYLVEKKIKITREMEVWLWKNRINLSSFVQAKIREEMEKDRSKQNMRRAKAK